ncbi:MAG: hypothetical protein ABEI52_12235, partial [Halobacteriaceae archaeon]
WRLQKFPIENEYFRYVLLIDWQPVGFEKVQVMHQGEKVETWKGDLTMHIESWLQLDYQNRWVDHWLMKHVDRFYRDRIWKKQRDRWKKDLWGETYALAGWLKQYLDMKSPFKQPDDFHPEKGVGPTPQG